MLCNFDMLCNFVLTLYKKLTFYKDLNKKAICKSSTVLSWICKKHAFRDFLSFSKKKISFIKKSVEQLKNKECKKRYHKKRQLRKFFNYV